MCSNSWSWPIVFISSSNFTQRPHLAGTKENLYLAQQVQAEWKEFGLDSVQLVHYDVLLSYPDENQPNYVSVIDEHGNEVLRTPVFANSAKNHLYTPRKTGRESYALLCSRCGTWFKTHGNQWFSFALFFFLNLYMLFLHFYASNSNNYPASCSLLTHMDERISMY